MPINQKYPFLKIDTASIASGMLTLFDESERTVLRFGMLPAKLIELLQDNVRKQIIKLLNWPDGHDVIELSGLKRDDQVFTDFGRLSLKQIVSDVVHEICQEIYKRGDLIV